MFRATRRSPNIKAGGGSAHDAEEVVDCFQINAQEGRGDQSRDEEPIDHEYALHSLKPAVYLLEFAVYLVEAILEEFVAVATDVLVVFEAAGDGADFAGFGYAAVHGFIIT